MPGIFSRLRSAITGGTMTGSPRGDFGAGGNTIYVGDLNDPRFAELLRGGQVTHSGVTVSPDNAMRVSAVLASVRLISRSIAMLPLQLFEKIGEDDNRQATDHPLYPVLYRKPNRWQTAMEYRSMMQGHVLLRGNAYAYKTIGVGGRVLEVIPLHPDRVEPKQLDDLSIVYNYARPNGGQVQFAQSEIHHLRDMTLDGIKGLSVITQAREAIGISMQAEVAGATMFRRGTLAGGALKAPNALSDQAYNRLRSDMEEKRSGAEHAGEWMILEEGLDVAQLGLTAADLQFLETRRFQVEDIARIFGVPPHMIGAMDKSTSWGQGIENQTIGFVVFTLQAWLTSAEQAIARDLLSEKDAQRFFAKHNLAALLRGSNDARANYLKAALGAGGSPAWMTQNEVRGVEDLNRIEKPEYDALPAPTKPAVVDQTKQGNTNEPPQNP